MQIHGNQRNNKYIAAILKKAVKPNQIRGGKKWMWTFWKNGLRFTNHHLQYASDFGSKQYFTTFALENAPPSSHDNLLQKLSILENKKGFKNYFKFSSDLWKPHPSILSRL